MNDPDVLVCQRITNPLVLKDNRLGKCCVCGWRIQFRPHASKKASKMCVECAFDRMDSDTRLTITRQTLEELQDFMRKKNQ